MLNDNDHQTIIHNLLGKSLRVAFLDKDSKTKMNTDLFSHNGIEGTFQVVDISSLPGNLSWKEIQKELKQMGDKVHVICNVTYQCNNRSNGDVKLEIRSSNGDLVVRMERKKRFGLLWLKDGDKEVPVSFADGTLASVIRVAEIGSSDVVIDVAGEDRLSFKCVTPAWQSRTKWILCAFLCFLPTLSLGGCFGFYKALNSDVVRNYSKIHQGAGVELGTFIENIIGFEGASSWKEKLALLTLEAYIMVDIATMPPQSHHNSHSF